MEIEQGGCYMRTSGIVLPVFSLPSEEGIGTLGKCAFDFVDFLFDSKQQYWQMPPINHTKDDGSPYSNFSVFAGNHNLIDVKKLVEQQLLDEKSYKKYIKVFKYDNESVNYKKINQYKLEILQKSFEQSFEKIRDKMTSFAKDNSYWLEDYALFVCLKKHVFSNKPWSEWDAPVKNRKKMALNIYSNQLKDKINFVIYIQYLFYLQWFELKRYANSKNIKILGEFPLYCDWDSAEVWAKANLFMLDLNFCPSEKLFCSNKKNYKKYNLERKVTYNIENLKKSHYRFLLQNIKFLNNIYDNLILDNFDQYDSYKYIKLGSKEKSDVFVATDNNQTNKKTNNKLKTKDSVAECVVEEKPGIKNDIFLIFQDMSLEFRPFLGDVDFANKLLDTYGLPVIKTMTDGFSKKQIEECLPHNFGTTDVVYISDYVFEPLGRFKKHLPGIQKINCFRYINNYSSKNFNYDFIVRAYQSAAEKILIPIQDVLETKKVFLNPKLLNKKLLDKNEWSWRISKKQLRKKTTQRLKKFFDLYQR